MIHQIEREYDVMSIRYRGIKAWSYLRLYLMDRITANREHKMSGGVVSLVLRSLFAYNPLHVFRKYDVWMLTGCERRKLLGDKMVQRVSGGIPQCELDSLMIEKPNREIGHYKREVIEEKNIISEAWLLMLTHIIEIALRPFKPKVEHDELIQKILEEKNLKFNYLHYLRLLNAQRKAMKMMLRITNNPKMVFMESPYDSMGYMWAFHEAGVKVIEMQHGVLNRNHNAYNAIDYEHQMNPDSICVFGEEEYKYFVNEKPQYAPEVRMTGLYMLERAGRFFETDIFAEERKEYDKIIVVAGQANAEKELGYFVDQVAAVCKKSYFVYVPRHNDEKLDFKSRNVRLKTGVNIYEYLKWADIHVTISSTTCLEAHYYHTPTIFVNFDNLAREYYGHILKEKNGAVYITKPEEFSGALNKLEEQKTEWRELFTHDHQGKIRELINENI